MVSFKKNPYKSPKIHIFEKIRTKIRTCTDKSVRVGTLAVSGQPSNYELHGVIRYLHLLGIPTCEIHRRLCTTYGENLMSN